VDGIRQHCARIALVERVSHVQLKRFEQIGVHGGPSLAGDHRRQGFDGHVADRDGDRRCAGLLLRLAAR
jgi:hypothetical protein